jgi:hypothetical protein
MRDTTISNVVGVVASGHPTHRHAPARHHQAAHVARFVRLARGTWLLRVLLGGAEASSCAMPRAKRRRSRSTSRELASNRSAATGSWCVGVTADSACWKATASANWPMTTTR